jgi:hypothetical protein
VLLFVIYITEIAFLAKRYDNSALESQFNVAGFVTGPLNRPDLERQLVQLSVESEREFMRR